MTIKKITRFLLTMILAVTAVLGGLVSVPAGTVKAEDTVSGLDFTEEQVMEIGGSTYRFQAYWANVQSDSTNEYHYKDDGTLVFTPQDVRSKTDAQLYLKLSIEGETVNDHPAGSIKFVVPGSVFEDWDGNPTGTLSTQIPKAPETNNQSDFNYTIDENTGDLIITNWKTITGAATLTSTFTYSTLPSTVPGGWEEEGEYAGPYYQGHKAVSCSVDTDGDGTENETFSQELNLEYHTLVSGTVKKEQYSSAYLNGVYYSWDNSWGTKPADANDYFYVGWLITYNSIGTISTQPWYTTCHELDMDGGELVSLNHTHNTAYATFAVNDTELVNHGEQTELAPGDERYWEVKSGSRVQVCYTVLVRYPYSMLEEAIANGVDVLGEGLTIHNTAAVVEHWQSGHEVTLECRATAKIRFNERGVGNGRFSKWNWLSDYYGRAYSHVISGAQSVLDLNSPADLIENNGRTWKIRYEGTASGIAWDDTNNTYINSEHTIMIEDNNPEIASSSIDRPLAWETEYTTLSDDDYQYVALYVGEFTEYDATYNRGSWQRNKNTKTNVNNPPQFDVYIRYANTSDYVYYTSNTALKYLGYGEQYYLYFGDHLYNKYGLTGSLAFPDNVAGFKIVCTSDAFQTKFLMTPVVSLRPTETVLNIVRNDLDKGVVTHVRNTAYLTETLKDGTVSKDHVSSHEGDTTAGNNVLDLTPFSSQTYLAKESSVIKDDPNSETQTTTESLFVFTYNGGVQEQFRDFYYLDKGTMYDLLPYGTDVDLSTLKGECLHTIATGTFLMTQSSSIKLADVPVEPEIIDNWENTGRKMLLLHYELPESINYANVNIAQKYQASHRNVNRLVRIRYDLINSYTNIRDTGINAIDTFALVPETENRVTFADGYDISKISDQEYYQNLEAENTGNIAYAQSTITYKPLAVLQSGLFKQSKALTSSKYDNNDVVLPNAAYSYRLSYTSSELVRTDKLVLYDVLEAGNKEQASEWQGVLNYVDVSSIAKKVSRGSEVTCDPKLYYSTTPREQLLTEDRQLKDEYEDLTNFVWTDTEPADKSAITAIAIDCRKNTDGSDFVLTGGGILVAYVHMISPADNTLKTKVAVNSFYSEARTYTSATPVSEETDRLTNSATMTMDSLDPDISKESDPPSGTRQDPAQIETNTELTYTINLKNTSALLPYKNAIITDDVPEGVTIHTDEIKVYTDDVTSAVLVSAYDGVTLTSSGQHLEFLVYELKAGKSIHFIVPVTVTAEEGALINDAVVKSIDDIDLNVHSNEVIHEVKSKITIHIFKTDDSGEKALAGASFQLTGPDTDLTKETGEDGIATFPDLKAGEYTLKEVKAAPGYQLSGLSWKVTIASGVATVKDLEGHVLTSTLNSDEEQVFHVKDGEVIQLLNTGGSGTKAFAFTGMLLMLIAVYFVKQKQAE